MTDAIGFSSDVKSKLAKRRFIEFLDVSFFLLFAVLNLLNGLEIYNGDMCSSAELNVHHAKLLHAEFKKILNTKFTPYQLCQMIKTFTEVTKTETLFKENICRRQSTLVFFNWNLYIRLHFENLYYVIIVFS